MCSVCATTEEDLSAEENLTMTQQADDYILENGINISKLFEHFKTESLEKSKEARFYIDANLHQILSLSHVLLLKRNEHSESALKSFGLENLDTLHKNILQKYVDEDSLMETTVFNDIVSILRVGLLMDFV